MKFQPKKFTDEQKQELNKVVDNQQVTTGVPKSIDPVNYPAFNIPVGKKVLVYVPNMLEKDENDAITLQMDKAFIHNYQIGKQFRTVRCVSGLEALGYSGCPICAANSECFDIANSFAKAECENKGLDFNSSDDAVKKLKGNYYQEMPVSNSRLKYTFPIVVIETDEKLNPLKDENNKIKYSVVFYTVSEKQYTKTWIPSLDSLDSSDPNSGHVGGKYFVLNYTNTEGGLNERAAAANNLSVALANRTADAFVKLAASFDKLVKEGGWTPEKAREVLTANMLLDENEMKEDIDKAMADYRSKGVAFEISQNGGNSAPAYSIPKAEEKGALEEAGDPIAGIETDI